LRPSIASPLWVLGLRVFQSPSPQHAPHHCYLLAEPSTAEPNSRSVPPFGAPDWNPGTQFRNPRLRPIDRCCDPSSGALNRGFELPFETTVSGSVPSPGTKSRNPVYAPRRRARSPHHFTLLRPKFRSPQTLIRTLVRDHRLKPRNSIPEPSSGTLVYGPSRPSALGSWT
jgi:hypothetical protein